MKYLKVDAYDGMSFFGGLVFFAPVALLVRVYLKNSLRLHHGGFSAISASGNLDLGPLNLRFPSLN